jgi:hypothetical protein
MSSAHTPPEAGISLILKGFKPTIALLGIAKHLLNLATDFSSSQLL